MHADPLAQALEQENDSAMLDAATLLGSSSPFCSGEAALVLD